MARKRKKKTNKRIKRKLLGLLFFVILLIIAYFAYPYLSKYLPSSSTSSQTTSESHNHTSTSTIYSEEDLSFHFMELGNEFAGDCVYIKAGDKDILIDAGSRKSSAETIINYVDNYCTDNTLEYVIATHAHQDHIAGFVGESNQEGIFDHYECEVIIDYSFKNTTSKISSDYEAKRNLEIQNGATHYTAKKCIENNPVFEISNGITMTVLDQKYYHEKSDDENNYSVCLLFSQNGNNFLFTGDLEKEGEESLADLNELPHVKLFKAGHHGSKTSSNECLLSEITPEVVVVCCCAGTNEYTENINNMFPTQDFINRVAKYTTNVYVTSQLNTYLVNENTIVSNGHKSMNGNIIISVNDKNEVVVNCSNNNIKLKDSEWFNTEITLSSGTRTFRKWPNVESMYN